LRVEGLGFGARGLQKRVISALYRAYLVISGLFCLTGIVKVGVVHPKVQLWFAPQ